MTKKILQISPYDFAHLGGVEKYAEILEEIFGEENSIKNFQKQENGNGWQNNFTTNSKNTQSETEQTNFSSKNPKSQIIFSTLSGGKDFEIIEPVKNCPLPRFWTKNFWKFVKKIRENPPEIIISHIRFAPTAWFAFWLSKRINAKYIHIEHGTGFLVHNNFFVKNIAKVVDLTIGKYILKYSYFVITISKAGENWVKNFAGRKENIETIYRGFEMKNGENKKIFQAKEYDKIFQKREGRGDKNFLKGIDLAVNDGRKADVNEEYRSFSKIFKIGFVGRLVPLKNLNSLLVALSKTSFQNWKLEIIGGGEMLGEWKNFAKNLGITEKIIWHGTKENSWILKNFLPNIDIFINPSLQEGLPTTVIEAKIAGCEVLATNVGGTHEIPDISLCEPTEKSLQENLEKIFAKNFQKKETSKNFKNKFSLEKMKENYENIFAKF